VSGHYRITAPVTTYGGKVGDDIQFNNGVYDGEVSDAAFLYFQGAGYGIEDLVAAKKADAAAAKKDDTVSADETARLAAEAKALADQAKADEKAAADAAAANQNGVNQ
jgi:hypothetical protein